MTTKYAFLFKTHNGYKVETCEEHSDKVDQYMVDCIKAYSSEKWDHIDEVNDDLSRMSVQPLLKVGSYQWIENADQQAMYDAIKNDSYYKKNKYITYQRLLNLTTSMIDENVNPETLVGWGWMVFVGNSYARKFGIAGEISFNEKHKLTTATIRSIAMFGLSVYWLLRNRKGGITKQLLDDDDCLDAVISMKNMKYFIDIFIKEELAELMKDPSTADMLFECTYAYRIEHDKLEANKEAIIKYLNKLATKK